MTQHALQKHTDEDRQIMRRLTAVVGVFLLASAVMAVAIAAILG